MAKFRSKLKRKHGGKQWIKGQSSISNPEITTHRAKAQSRFFQSNISLGKKLLFLINTIAIIN